VSSDALLGLLVVEALTELTDERRQREGSCRREHQSGANFQSKHVTPARRSIIGMLLAP